MIEADVLQVFGWSAAPLAMRGAPDAGMRAGPGDEPIPISDPEEDEGYGDEDDDDEDEDDDDDEEPMQLRP